VSKRIALQIAPFSVVSEKFLEAVIEEQVSDWWHRHQSRLIIENVIRAHPSCVYMLSPQPNRADDRAYLGDLPLGLVYNVSCVMQSHLKSWCSDRQILFCAQPTETLTVDGLFTCDVFSIGSVKMEKNAPHDDGDRVHMNKDFGERVLRDVLILLGHDGRSLRE
jgi:hypothetical protein